MKRKLYVRQMEMSKVNEASNDCPSHTTIGKSGSEECSTAVISIPVTPEVSASIVTNQDKHSPQTIPSISSVPTTSLAVSHASIGRQVVNTTPLPKVDVLIKSSLRAFQISDNQSNIYIGKNIPGSPQIEGPRVEGPIPSQSDLWKKDSETGHDVVLAPLTANSHFDMDYTQPTNYEVRESSVDLMKREPHDASPVYHQMERPVQPLSGPGMYVHQPAITPDYIELQNQVNGVHNGKHESQEMIGVHKMESYSNESSDQDDDQFQEYEHIRAWEQENSRYVDYNWRGEEHQHHNADVVYVKENTETDARILNEGNTSQKAKRNSSKLGGNGKVSGGGSSTRRRRKRVQTPVQRSAANMRERRRMCHLNVAFDHLKDHLPHVKDKKKLSRIQTLKAAIYYIHLLQDSLNTAPRVSEL